MENKGVSLAVSQDIVREIVQTQISAEVMKALNGKDVLIEQLVKQVLSIKTQSDGTMGSSDYYNKYNYIEVILGQAVRNKAKEIVNQWVVTKAPEIEKAITKGLVGMAPKIAASFVKRFAEDADKRALDIKVNIIGEYEQEQMSAMWRDIDTLKKASEAKAK